MGRGYIGEVVKEEGRRKKEEGRGPNGQVLASSFFLLP